jgi:hypothetical protein
LLSHGAHRIKNHFQLRKYEQDENFRITVKHNSIIRGCHFDTFVIIIIGALITIISMTVQREAWQPFFPLTYFCGDSRRIIFFSTCRQIPTFNKY